MTITWQGIEPSKEMEAAILRGVGQIADPQIVVTDDIEAAVRVYPGYEAFTADRVSGQVGGKVLRVDGGVLILNAPALLERGLEYMERVACHESGHILTVRRGEAEFIDLPGGKYGDGDLRGIGVHVIDEYRAERRTVERGYVSTIDTEEIGHLLHAVNCQILLALEDSTVDHVTLAQGILDPLERASKQIAVFAANDPDANFVSQLSAPSRILWDSYVGDCWVRFAGPLAAGPHAGAPDADLTERVASLRQAEESLLTQFGFSFVEDEHGYGFLRIGTDELFNSRVRMSMDFVAAYSV